LLTFESITLKQRHRLIAIGIGCRRGCPAKTISDLVERALKTASCACEGARLFTHTAKLEERGILEAANALGLPLEFLTEDVLHEAAGRAATRSHAVLARFGLPSLAETAALAGAGPASTLLLARVSAGGASCAIATPFDGGA